MKAAVLGVVGLLTSANFAVAQSQFTGSQNETTEPRPAEAAGAPGYAPVDRAADTVSRLLSLNQPASGSRFGNVPGIGNTFKVDADGALARPGATMGVFTTLNATGNATLGSNAGGNVALILNSMANHARWIRFQSGGVDRFALGADSTPEENPSLGPDFFVSRYDASGKFMGSPLRIFHATGMVGLNEGAAVTRGLQTDGLYILKRWDYHGAPTPQNTAVYSDLNISGHATPNAFASAFSITSDTVAVKGTFDGVLINHQFGGAAMTGGRVALQIKASQVSPTGNASLPGGPQYLSLATYVGAAYNEGGTSLLENGTKGGLWGANVIAVLGPKASYFTGLTGIEVNNQIPLGASVLSNTGVQAILYPLHQVQGLTVDAAFIASSAEHPATGVGWRNGFEVGAAGARWPLDKVNGNAFSILPSFDFPGVPNQMAWGFYGREGTYSGGLINGPNFSVDGVGTVQIGTSYLRQSEHGLVVDASGRIGSLASIVSGGTGYTRTNWILRDPYGGVWYVSNVAGDRITALKMYRAPYVNGSPPKNPVVLIPDPMTVAWGAGGAVAVNLDWTPRNQVQINPSGDTLIGTGATLARNAVSGFLLAPTMAGSPTGVAGGKGHAAFVVDSTDDKLCWSTGNGRWKCVAGQ